LRRSKQHPIRKKRYVLLFLIALTIPVHARWEQRGALPLPQHAYCFLSSTPTGDLLAVTFNRNRPGNPPEKMPAFLIRNPLSKKPDVKILCRDSFASDRGYSGVATDELGNYYISGDTGDPSTSFIRKFHPDGTPHHSFGTNGTLFPGKRCLGIDVVGNYLIVAVDWGEVLILDIAMGETSGKVPKAPAGFDYIRDIAIDPSFMRIFALVEGCVVMWEGGYPWSPGDYRFRPLTKKLGKRISCEGISFDPINQTALFIPLPRDKIIEVDAKGKIYETTLPLQLRSAHLVDSALSKDGTTLFLSGLESKTIHVFRRRIKQSRAIAPSILTATPLPEKTPLPTPAEFPTVQIGRVMWYRSSKGIVEYFKRHGKPVIIYFRRAGDQNCLNLEWNILMKEQFSSRAEAYACIFEDLSIEKHLASRFNVTRLPHMEILDRNGEHVATAQAEIDMKTLLAIMDFAAK